MKQLHMILGHALILDLIHQNTNWRCVNIYAPVLCAARKQFWSDIHKWILPNESIVLGNFNSVTSPVDHIPGKLDAMSVQLAAYLEMWNIFELSGSHTYTYQHLSVKDRKSQIDRIYVPNDLCQQTYVFSQWNSLSNHMVVIMAPNKKDFGPSQWRMPDDVIKLPKTEAMIQDLTNRLSTADFSPEIKWEICKQEIRSWCQQFTKFR